MTRPLRLFVIAGEPSGDRLGADLMAGLRAETGGAVTFAGLGGGLMRGQGLHSLFPIDELSIMGLAEVLPRIPALRRRIRQTADAVADFAPDALVTIDSPDFCLRVARLARAAAPDLRTIHYVAPSVWAWRPGRAAKMAKVIDHVLALLPFEPPYMEAAGMTCDFVGHPVAAVPVPDDTAKTAIRQRLGVAPDVRLLTVLPGSRAGEVARHGPVFAEALTRLRHTHPDLATVIPTLPPRREALETIFGQGAQAPRIVLPSDLGPDAEAAKMCIFAASDAALAVSGTVSVELAAAGCPMVVAYKANALTTALAKRLVKVRYASLVNILLDRMSIPEFLAEAATPQALASAVAKLLDDPTARAAQRTDFDHALALLGRGDTPGGLRAAQSVLRAIG